MNGTELFALLVGLACVVILVDTVVAMRQRFKARRRPPSSEQTE